MRRRSCCRAALRLASLSGSGACCRRCGSSGCCSKADAPWLLPGSCPAGCNRLAAVEPRATGLRSRGSGSSSCTVSPCCSPASACGSGGGCSASCCGRGCCAAARPGGCWACRRCCLRPFVFPTAMPLAVAPASANARAASPAPPRSSSRLAFSTAMLIWPPTAATACWIAPCASAAAAGCNHRHACMPLLPSLGHSSSWAGQMAPRG